MQSQWFLHLNNEALDKIEIQTAFLLGHDIFQVQIPCKHSFILIFTWKLQRVASLMYAAWKNQLLHTSPCMNTAIWRSVFHKLSQGSGAALPLITKGLPLKTSSLSLPYIPSWYHGDKHVHIVEMDHNIHFDTAVIFRVTHWYCKYRPISKHS